MEQRRYTGIIMGVRSTKKIHCFFAGCGTGLVAKLLKKAGAGSILPLTDEDKVLTQSGITFETEMEMLKLANLELN